MGHKSEFKFRGSDDFKERWASACERMRVSQSEVFQAIAEIWLSQDELTREAMIRRGASVKIAVKK